MVMAWMRYGEVVDNGDKGDAADADGDEDGDADGDDHGMMVK